MPASKSARDKIDTFINECRRHLTKEGLIDRPGGILYSEPETLLRSGPIYLLGTNPGGDEADHTIRAGLLSKNFWSKKNDYLDDSWEWANHNQDPGEHPLQQRIKYLLKGLGQKPRTVCASNLVFMQSASVENLPNFRELAEKCWPIHEHIIDLINPRVIIAYGNGPDSAYDFLKRKYAWASKEATRKSGHGNWKIKSFLVKTDRRLSRIIGIPHPSRYAVDQYVGALDHIKKWVRE